MANDKVIRQARSSQPMNAKDEFSTEYNLADREVDFPVLVFIIFLVIDIVDIIMAIFVITSFFWSIFTIGIVFPFQIWYFSYREKKYSESDGAGFQFNVKEVQDFRKKVSQIQKINKEAADLLKAGNKAGAAAKLGQAKKIFPKGMRWASFLAEKVPFLNVIPLNSISIILSYLDNKESVRATTEGYKILAGSFDFRLSRKIVRNSTRV